ncbi:hypothetical protein CSB45_14775 [candidate division KSB3 bacterium]|uniref:DUF6531 domain-containing protein n=1 Tax=candidate division KSB3 bacterium TaxID=2044937 RepID=A0A2G6E0W2_9BACT|nr:MAG: hypothetical protein CSB45_14775 [candidate division KSB3 bacterium]PIE31087.1 MAG: hypothetical protein CSA57_00290 [candidate division KSB3 bacterium]
MQARASDSDGSISRVEFYLIDFNIPELGYPLLLGRVYDSRNRHDGSFGTGWSLPHEGWGEEARGSFLRTYYVILRTRKVLALRLGDGAVFGTDCIRLWTPLSR